MRKIELTAVTTQDLIKEAIAEAKLLYKHHKEKLMVKNVVDFDYEDPRYCFYGTIFDHCRTAEAVDFKNKHKLKAYIQSHPNLTTGEYLLVDEHTREKTLTALEIVSFNMGDLGDAINAAARLDFKVDPLKLVDLRIF